MTQRFQASKSRNDVRPHLRGFSIDPAIVMGVAFFKVNRFPRLLPVVLLYVLLSLVCSGVRAQEPSSPGSPPPLSLTTDAVSHRFLAVHGRRALISGYAANSLEIWAYPFQIVSGYQVAFRSAGSTTPIPGEEILARVSYEPDAITRIFLGPDFIVRETLFVPLNEPGAILTYSVESAHPVDIEIHAQPILNLMWPAALGGQSAEWNSLLSAFVLSVPPSGISAVVGSPDVTSHDEIGNRTVLGVTDAGLGLTIHPDQKGVARLYVALNPAHAADAGAVLRKLIHDRLALEAEFREHVLQVRSREVQLHTPDERVNQAFAWSELALDQAWVCNIDLGCGYVAGYGPSRGARRPQYDWFFAGDGLIAADAAITAGDRDRARQELEFILHYQDRKTGMIWHELSQSAGYLDWVGKYPYMFVHVDLTFQFLGTLARYVQSTGDMALVREHWQDIEAAYRYCTAVIDPATALPRIPADKEGGNEQDRMSDDLGLSASWVEAASGFAELAEQTGHVEIAAQAKAAAEHGRSAIAQRYWSADQAFWISGHSQSGAVMQERRSGPSEALTLHLFSPQQESQLLDQLASAAFQTDWGTRGVGAGSAGFDPESYSKGSVSAVGTASLATAFWKEHRPVTAFALWSALLPWTCLDSLGHMHEVLAGNVYRPQVESVPEQTWSSAAFVESTLHGLLGLEIDAAKRRVRFAPHLPASWTDVAIAQIPLPSLAPVTAGLAFRLHRTASGISLEVDNTGEPFQFDFAPELPLGATLVRAALDQHRVAASVESSPAQSDMQETQAHVSMQLPRGKSRIDLQVQGGVAIFVNQTVPLLGTQSKGIRVLNVKLRNRELTITADVPTKGISEMEIQTSWKVLQAKEATVTPLSSGGFSLSFAAQPKSGGTYRRAVAVIKFTP